MSDSTGKNDIRNEEITQVELEAAANEEELGRIYAENAYLKNRVTLLRGLSNKLMREVDSLKEELSDKKSKKDDNDD